MADDEYEICGTLTPKGIRRLMRRVVIGLVLVIGLAIWFTVSSSESDSLKTKAREEENLALVLRICSSGVRPQKQSDNRTIHL